jgi:hypothetical protein
MIASRSSPWTRSKFLMKKRSLLFVHGDPAMTKVHTFVWLVCVAPDLVASTGVDSPDVVRHGEVQHAVDEQWGGFDGCSLAGLKCPHQWLAKVLGEEHDRERKHPDRIQLPE